MSGPRRRAYSSALRDNQAQGTRELILDALTELLTDQPADQITTRAIAERAGVSQPTVYRHFPDRQALLEGLSDRISAMATTAGGGGQLKSLGDIAAHAARDFALPEENAVLATAEAILNADPRRLSRSSRSRSADLRRLVADSLPDLDEREHNRITALLRSLYSVQTWLRMREEFGIPGTESGPIVAWAIDILVNEIRAGHFPPSGHPNP
jgi:AcrR family transcriptional regulator